MAHWTLNMLTVPLLVGLIASAIVFFLEKRWKVGERSEWARAIFAFLMTALISFNMQTLYEVNMLVHRSDVDQLKRVKNSLDPDLLLIFGSHFDELIDGMRSVIEKHEMRLSDIDQYRFFYKKFLAAYPDATFYATSLPREEYFWSPGQVRKNSVEEAIHNFIGQGGRFERIFFTSGPESPQKEEERRVMNLHSQLGIKVYYIDDADVSPEQRRFFLVASNGKVAAEATLGMDSKISELVITVDQSRADYYLRLFEKLKQHPKLQEYQPETKVARLPQ